MHRVTRVHLFLLALLAGVAVAPATASAQDSPTDVEVGLLVINFGNYDVNKGTYTVDLYLWFTWTPPVDDPGFTPERFEFANGRATSKERIFDETDGAGRREIWFRIQANLYSEPTFADYPFDAQHLEILMEDAVATSDRLRYVVVDEGAGLDPEFRVPGWRVMSVQNEVVNKTYSFGESYDRFRFVVTVQRETVSTALKSFLPPTAFILVAALGFFLHPSKVANRLTLGTSMLIAAVMFHISQIVNLPPLGALILFDKVMIAVYSFMACCLGVATLIAIDEDYWKDRDHTREINRYGAVASVTVPVLVFLFLAWA